MSAIRICPSMMCADFFDLRGDLAALEQGGADYLHVDIMDGHYVPNFTLGIDFCRKIAARTTIPFDVHLMIENVDNYIPMFAGLPGSPLVSFHPEVSYHPVRTIQLIRSSGGRPAIALDPSVPVEQVRNLVPLVDMVLVMTVSPGYAGQKIVPGGIDLIRETAEYCRRINPDVLIEVDGNVSWELAPQMIGAGAQMLVAGTSSPFDGKAPLTWNMMRMKELCAGVDTARKTA